MNLFVPTADFCYGRTEIINKIINNSISEGVTFLFGGRQSGKTTVLLKIQKDLADRLADSPTTLDIIVPVYINLLRLPGNTTTESLFQLIVDESVQSCNKLFSELTLEVNSLQITPRDSVKSFEDNVSSLIDFFKEKHIHFLYLFDEAQKIFKDNFSIGLNDNLFYIFYMSEKISGNISAVFSGSQELYKLIEDKGTSPLGSRASLEYITNLKEQVIDEMISININFQTIEERKQFINKLFDYSGGHAGICAYITKQCLLQGIPVELEVLIQNFLDKHGQLFNIWFRSLSPEAVIIHNLLIENNHIDIKSIPKTLQENNLNSIHSDWATKQILFTGMGYKENQRIRANNLYVNYMKHTNNLADDLDEDDSFEIAELLEKPITDFTSADCSRLLDRLENGFRKLIANRLSTVSPKWWKQRVPEDIRTRAEERKKEREKDYPGMTSQNRPLYDYLDFMDIPQIITMKLNWTDMFKDIFKKQEIIIVKLSEISLFRNDIAHNRDLPSSDKELFITNARQLLRTINSIQ